LTDESLKNLLDKLDKSEDIEYKFSVLNFLSKCLFSGERVRRLYVKALVQDGKARGFFKKLDSEIPNDVRANIDNYAKV